MAIVDRFRRERREDEEETGVTPSADGYTSSVAYGDTFPSRGRLTSGAGG